MDILKGEIKIYSINDDEVYEVDFMNLVVDKADGLKVVDCDNHFCEFTGVHPSKIKQGKLFLHNIIKPIYREEIMRALCKKNAQVKIMIIQAFAGSPLPMCQNRRSCKKNCATKRRK